MYDHFAGTIFIGVSPNSFSLDEHVLPDEKPIAGRSLGGSFVYKGSKLTLSLAAESRIIPTG